LERTKDREQYGRACQPKIHDAEELPPVNHVRQSSGRQSKEEEGQGCDC